MLLDEDSMERRVEVLAIADARGLDRGQRIEHRAGSERQAGFTQGAGEVDDVLRQEAGACGLGFGVQGRQTISFALSCRR